MSVEILTFGCRLNAYESEAIRARAAEARLENALIINTCAVTAEAVRQSRQAIRRARREQPQRRIVVTGCAAQIEPQTYAAMAEVDLVIGNSEKLVSQSFQDFGVGTSERVRVNDIMSVRETASQMVDCFEGPTRGVRAFLQVQNGCDHRCTFCIIPYARGNSRSVPMGSVIAEAKRLTASGIPELVLTGVDLTAYGADLPGSPGLGQLVRKLLAMVPEVRRLRLSSIDTIEADGDLMRAIAALSPLGAIRRRPGSEAHEATAHARRHDLVLRFRARASTQCFVRRRPDRRLPDRNRGHVSAQHGSRRRSRANEPTRFSLQPALGHAGSAHASTRQQSGKGTRCSVTRQRRRRREAPASVAGVEPANAIGGADRDGAQRVLHAGRF